MADTRIRRAPPVERWRSGPMAARGAWPAWGDFFDSPFGLMRRMSEDADRMFEAGDGFRSWWPAIEVTRHATEVVVYAELPGLGRDEVTLECSDQGLVIEGEKRRETVQEGESLVMERAYGRFYREVPLPEGADLEHADASFKDGVLEVRIPLKPEQVKSKRIPISG